MNIAAPNPIEAETQDEAEILTAEVYYDEETQAYEEEMIGDAEEDATAAAPGNLAQVVETNQVGNGPMSVIVYAGDARSFNNPPELWAFANAD